MRDKPNMQKNAYQDRGSESEEACNRNKRRRPEDSEYYPKADEKSRECGGLNQCSFGKPEDEPALTDCFIETLCLNVNTHQTSIVSGYLKYPSNKLRQNVKGTRNGDDCSSDRATHEYHFYPLRQLFQEFFHIPGIRSAKVLRGEII